MECYHIATRAKHQLADADVMMGLFGTAPKKTADILDIYNLEYETISGTENMNKEGVYIMSYWSGDSVFDGIHTVAVDYSNQKYTLYNNGAIGLGDNNNTIGVPSVMHEFDDIMKQRFIYSFYLGGQ